MRVKRKFWLLVCLCLVMLLAACAPGQSSKGVPAQPFTGDSLNIAQQQAPSPTISIPRQLATAPPTRPVQTYHPGPAPWGAPPLMTAEEIQLTQQLFNQMNSDRAARGLYPFTWNPALASGARLHSWNMYHCGLPYLPRRPEPMHAYRQRRLRGLHRLRRMHRTGRAIHSSLGQHLCRTGKHD